MVSVNDVHAAGQAEVAPEREAGVRLAAVNGPTELQQVLLALLIPAGSKLSGKSSLRFTALPPASAVK